MKKILFALVVFYTYAINAANQQPSPTAIEQKIAVCVACHGQQGISVNPQWPNLAGQHASYLFKQLKDYKAVKTRNVPTMTAIVANLNENDMLELAKYYSEQTLPKGATPEKFVQRGQQLYRGGDFDKHITACIACHGPKGTGNEQAGFPVLSGQHAAYTILQLQAFKEGKRSNDLNGIMRDISSRMSQEDMEAVAYYIQGLH
ncbi:c-type cytochrome [Legionella jordanis]|uniref:Cytochrome c4 n=1 Tax=Legionella jordanis TaxID=456 RepID=A0A0W0VC93_9GAMM|nr:c-type cytochrome [Legionella jordanis]KTD17726.1 cytochrome c4 [Legionella jordanis]RMX01590.1 cytochrome c4 [Legionella jordanis]RMX21586.1 cytochrome c4 [Legionella jordanis]VEH11340.1 cytochrome c4 [Legionella jordanis]HAT8714498.1 c-type cytochrome [Legionella jordanis]